MENKLEEEEITAPVEPEDIESTPVHGEHVEDNYTKKMFQPHRLTVKESYDVNFISEKSTHNLDETKTSLFSIDSILVAEPIMCASTQKGIQGFKSTSTTVLELDEFTSDSRSGGAEDHGNVI